MKCPFFQIDSSSPLSNLVTHRRGQNSAYILVPLHPKRYPDVEPRTWAGTGWTSCFAVLERDAARSGESRNFCCPDTNACNLFRINSPTSLYNYFTHRRDATRVPMNVCPTPRQPSKEGNRGKRIFFLTN
jgi:hypothetical protein